MYKDYEVKLNAILDTHKGVVELKDIKTVEKIVSDVKSIVPKLDTEKKKLKVLQKRQEKSNKEFIKIVEKDDKMRPKLREAEKKFNLLQQDYEEISDRRFSINKNKLKDEKDLTVQIKTFEKLRLKSKKIISDLEKNIKLLKSAAKKLGVDVNVSKYESVLSNLKKSSNPF